MVKKVLNGTQRKTPSVRELIEQNKWNPFERVDPKILEMLHRKHEKNAENTRRYFLLSQTEDAPV